MNPPPAEELDLVKRCVAGDTAAWQTFLKTSAPAVRRAVHTALLRRRGRAQPDDIDNLTQQILLDLLKDGARKLATFQGRSRLATWLGVVAARAVLNAVAEDPEWRSVRDARGQGWVAALRRQGEAESPLQRIAREEERRAVQSALRFLPARDQLLLRLVYQEGLSYAEAGRALSVSPNSISPLLERARTRFRAVVSEHHPELLG